MRTFTIFLTAAILTYDILSVDYDLLVDLSENGVAYANILVLSLVLISLWMDKLDNKKRKQHS